MIENLLELRAGLPRTAPRQRKRQTAVRARQFRPREMRAIGEAVAVLERQPRYPHQPEAAALDDTRRLGRVVEQLDLDRAFVDDDDEHYLARVLDRRVALEHLHLFELVRRFEPRGNGLYEARRERRADFDPGQPAQLFVGSEHVALRPDVGDDFGGLGGRGLPEGRGLPIGSVCL